MTSDAALAARRPPGSVPATLLVAMTGLIGLLLNHTYRGLFHDARLYLLQALSHLRPDSLTRDIFLRYGSQDQYTLFSRPLAVVIRVLGVDYAEALLTCASQALLLAGAWVLARGLSGRSLALLGLAVFIVMRGSYGPRGLFTVIEPFLTPRMMAEALVLAGLAAMLAGRGWLALLLMAGAGLCHPLVSMGGLVALAAWYVVIPWPRASAVAVLAVSAALILAAGSSPAGLLSSFDPHWLELVSRRSPILFLRSWDAYDWARLAPPFAALVVGAVCLAEARGRRLCVAVMITVAGAIFITGLACDGLHLVSFTQLQPWRWQWLGYTIAALLLPAILQARWNEGPAVRPTVMLLLAVWVFGDYPGGAWVAVLVVASLWLTPRIAVRELRLVWVGACSVLAIACLWRIASNLEFTESSLLDSRLPQRLRMMMALSSDGTLLLSVLGLIVWVERWPGTQRRAAWVLLGMSGVAAMAALVPPTVLALTRREFSAEYRDALAPFRAAIPPGDDVLWDGPGTAAWVLLERPNYLLPADTAGMLYSRPAALEMERRALTLSAAIPPDTFLTFDQPLELHLSRQQLLLICRIGVIHFLITRQDLDMAPLERVAPNRYREGAGLRLYACPPAYP